MTFLTVLDCVYVLNPDIFLAFVASQGIEA